jgi:CspA family cold shock protein
MQMQQGTIKFYNDQKGFGFITYDGGDIFFHIKQCEEGYLPEQDQTVTFEITE